jgi:hypothetical protein
MLGKIFLILSGVLLSTDGSGFMSALVCIKFPTLLGLTLLPANDVTEWLTDIMGIQTGDGKQ